MLTLIESKEAVPIVGMYDTKRASKKPLATVYFTHQVDLQNSNVAAAEGVLTLHKKAIKKREHLNDEDYSEICRMIDTSEEPEIHHPLRHSFWHVKEHYDRLLKREMFIGDIGDDDSVEFQLNFPLKPTDWPGTFTCIASSGGGKTHFVVAMILRYWKRCDIVRRRPVIWLSPELEIDKTLEPLKKERWRLWFHGIDISEQNLRKKGMDAASYFQTEIQDKIESVGENALVVFDDFPDGAQALYPFLERLYNSMLRVARHRNMGVVSLIHTYAHGKASSQALQSNKNIIFYPRSQQSRCVQFLRDFCQLPTSRAKELVRRFGALDRWMCIQMHSPVCIYCSKYLILL